MQQRGIDRAPAFIIHAFGDYGPDAAFFIALEKDFYFIDYNSESPDIAKAQKPCLQLQLPAMVLYFKNEWFVQKN